MARRGVGGGHSVRRPPPRRGEHRDRARHAHRQRPLRRPSPARRRRARRRRLTGLVPPGGPRPHRPSGARPAHRRGPGKPPRAPGAASRIEPGADRRRVRAHELDAAAEPHRAEPHRAAGAAPAADAPAAAAGGGRPDRRPRSFVARRARRWTSARRTSTWPRKPTLSSSPSGSASAIRSYGRPSTGHRRPRNAVAPMPRWPMPPMSPAIRTGRRGTGPVPRFGPTARSQPSWNGLRREPADEAVPPPPARSWSGRRP